MKEFNCTFFFSFYLIIILSIFLSLYFNEFFQIKNFPIFKFDNSNIIEKKHGYVHFLALDCLKNSNSPYGYSNIPIKNDLEKKKNHYLNLINLTEKYRNFSTHCWADYCGPWIEEIWISHFCCNRSLNNFGPFIPLFISWLNIWKYYESEYNYKEFLKEIFLLLSPNYIYITVVQSSLGIESSFDPWTSIPSNLLILNPAGKGHIPIPHLKQEEDFLDLKKPLYKVLFGGDLNSHQSRSLVVNSFQEKLKDLFIEGKWNNWKEKYQESEFILSPRGFGRATFRTFEVLQLGMIPIITFTDYLWLPYYKSKINWDEISIYGFADNINDMINQVLLINDSKKNLMINKIKKIKNSHFTYSGIMNQIQLFMLTGYHESDLRCEKYYIQQ